MLKWKRIVGMLSWERVVGLLRWERVMEGGDNCMVVEVGVIMERMVKRLMR